jgi:FkbM family methyltransferase
VPLLKNARILLQALQSGGGQGVFEAISDKLRRIRNQRPGNLARLDGASFNIDPERVPADVRYLLLSEKYELPERHALPLLDPTTPVVEFGACLGVVSCITNALLLNRENQVVVEANPALLPLLHENRGLNDAKFHVVHAALGYEGDEIRFGQSDNILASSVQNGVALETSITVPAVTLARLLDRFQFERCSLICDVEGVEYDLVRNERHVLKDRVESIIMEIHDSMLGQESVSEIHSILADSGFKQVFEEHETRAFRNSQFTS